ncbi:glutamate-5-semialdehyde dehydrogenase [Chytriomyces sp. MP71]|nr:glutamate-5-semialdehyde dehydrogenase [Chytriomyces sp. MP71]
MNGEEEKKDCESLAIRARAASLRLQTASCEERNAALQLVRTALIAQKDAILAENQADIEVAKKLVAAGSLSGQLLKRLDLSGNKFTDMVSGVKDIAAMEDPVNKTTLATRLDSGLDLYRVSCPIGVVLIIFEARPEVVVNIASLALKSGNAVILKGGKEASRSNAILHKIISDALSQSETISKDSVLLVESRTAIDELLKLDRYIDLVIPRGSNSLVRHIQGSTRLASSPDLLAVGTLINHRHEHLLSIPVLGHADGLCTTYLDEHLDPEMAIRVLIDAKTSAPSACNSTETLLVHESHLKSPFFGKLVHGLTGAGIKLRMEENCYKNALALLKSPHDVQNDGSSEGQVNTKSVEHKRQKNSAHEHISEATVQDFDTEFLDTILAVKAVANVTAAIAHINSHGSHHTDAIITSTKEHAEQFMRSVDSADVFCNCSTRFADGFRFGFGAEIGVSTNKTHARGPVGLEGMLIYKFRLYGSGQCTTDYGTGKKEYLHEALPFQKEKFQL